MDSFVWQRELQYRRAFWLMLESAAVPSAAAGRPQVPYWDTGKDVLKARPPPIRGSTFWGSESVQRKNAWTDGVLCSSSNCMRSCFSRANSRKPIQLRSKRTRLHPKRVAQVDGVKTIILMVLVSKVPAEARHQVTGSLFRERGPERIVYGDVRVKPWLQ